MAYKKLKLWFDVNLAKELSTKINSTTSAFNSKHFTSTIEKNIDELELKDRVTLFAKLLNESLNGTFANKIEILLNILGPENTEETGMFKKYYWIMPIAKFVENYGLDDFKKSMKAIEEITKRNTGEYCIRPFIEKYPDKTVSQMRKWSKNKNKHIRRLSSEGCRPRLPWATQLTMFVDDPTPIFTILENLKDDESKYVQKSVSNCINDILKDNLTKGRLLIDSWILDASKSRKWIIKHGIRNKIKQNDPWAHSILKQIR